MRSIACPLLCAICLAGGPGVAQHQNKTEAQQDGLAGPVKSVTTLRQTAPGVNWQQPAGPTIVIPVWCSVCDYAPDGYRTRAGDLVDGKYVGEHITLDRNPAGQLASLQAIDAETGKLTREERFGPFGITELNVYADGKLASHQLFRYDDNGHQSEWLTWDGNGTATSRDVTVSAKDGTVLTKSSWSGDGTLQWRTSFDPASDRDEIIVNETSGAPALRRVAEHGRTASFWEASEDTDRFGQKYIIDRSNGEMEVHECHRASGCSVSRVHYEYAGPGKLNPASAEWRDANGNLEWAAYYDYEFDSAHNWTHRKVWVVSPEQKQRTLYEEDWRTLTYWIN